MAILKNFITGSLVQGQYHRIVKIEAEIEAQTIRITTAVYANEAARREGAQAFWHEYTTVRFDQIDGDARAVFYPMLSGLFGGYLVGGEPDCAVTHPATLALKDEAKLPPLPPQEPVIEPETPPQQQTPPVMSIDVPPWFQAPAEPPAPTPDMPLPPPSPVS